MVEKVHILFAYLREVINPFNLHWFSFYPVTVFPVAALSCNLTNIYFWIEVCSKWITVVTSICIKYINIVNFIKMVLLCVCREYACYARVKATAQKCSNSSLFRITSYNVCYTKLLRLRISLLNVR